MFAIFRQCRTFALGLAAITLIPLAASAEQLGSELTPLLDAMERSHPALSAAAASRDAAAADVEIASALEDPQFEISFEDIDREEGGPLPQRLGSIFYSIEQTFPLGGKRTLRREVAKAGVAEAATERAQTLVDLKAQMKTAFAQHYLALFTADVTRKEGEALRDLAEVAQERYAQGLGRQQEAIEAAAELAALTSALADAERDRVIAVSRINALIDRPLEAPLAPPAALPPVPDVARLDLASLLAQANERNPALAQRNAAIEGATAATRLAERNWYPDVTLGFSIVDEEREISGYEAKVGFNIPLQWGLRRAQQGQAKARLAEARARSSATRIELANRIAEALHNLRAATVREETMRREQLPRLEEAVEAVRRAYAVDQADLADVLSALRRLRQAELQRLGMLFEQQTLLAELERLVGGDL
jgi:cobalt-zinc-cadmium efflux system outer membrane protein